MVHPRVLQALCQPLLGHLDPVFLALMNEIQTLLRATFHTRNEFTIALSGTGSAGMEAVIANLIEPGDRAIVGVNGVFGARLATMIERSGGIPIPIEAPWGATIPIEALEQELAPSSRLRTWGRCAAHTMHCLSSTPSLPWEASRSRSIPGESTPATAARRSA